MTDHEQGLRNRLQASLVASLVRVLDEDDLTPHFDPGTIGDAHLLNGLLRDGDGDLTSRYLLGLTYWRRYQTVPPGQGRPDLLAAAGMFVDCFRLADEGADMPGPLLKVLISVSHSAAIELQKVVSGSSDEVLLSATITLWRGVVAALPAGHGDRPAALSMLAYVLMTRSALTGSLADLDAAVRAGQEVVATVPIDNPSRAAILFNVWLVMNERFHRTGARSDLDVMIEIGRPALEAIPVYHPDHAFHLGQLGVALGNRFERDGVQADGDAAIDALREAIAGVSAEHPARA